MINEFTHSKSCSMRFDSLISKLFLLIAFPALTLAADKENLSDASFQESETSKKPLKHMIRNESHFGKVIQCLFRSKKVAPEIKTHPRTPQLPFIVTGF